VQSATRRSSAAVGSFSARQVPAFAAIASQGRRIRSDCSAAVGLGCGARRATRGTRCPVGRARRRARPHRTHGQARPATSRPGTGCRTWTRSWGSSAIAPNGASRPGRWRERNARRTVSPAVAAGKMLTSALVACSQLLPWAETTRAAECAAFPGSRGMTSAHGPTLRMATT
jgi:hypothetical protein